MEAAARRYFGKPARRAHPGRGGDDGGPAQGPLRARADERPRPGPRAGGGRAAPGWQDEGFITPAQAQAARAKPAKLAPESEEIGAWFVDWVLDGLTGQLGKPERDLVVHTTLDRRVQRAAEAAVERTLAETGARTGSRKRRWSCSTSTVPCGRWSVGAITRQGPFNRAVAARRQPGSAFKPFVYLTALEAGWQPDNTIDDRAGPDRQAGSRRTSTASFRGQITLTEAFAHSVNTAAVRLAQTVGPARVVATARELGIASAMQPVPSIALGTSEVSLLELTGAYLPFATGGIRRPLYGVSRVRGRSRRVLYRHVPTEVRVVAPEAAAGMRRLMSAAVADGTGRAARLPDRAAAGKTGTTQNGRDAWFVGYAGDYVAGVWLGNDDNRPMKGVCGQQPAGADLARGDARHAQAAPRPPPPTPVRKPEPEGGLDWLIDLFTGDGARS